ncbi:hypothetical protein CQ011_02335 [Arthrobacter sp. MYb213]|nr:hypothetical protein CQ011_02335 [Arthrobacter sp. MYb213]
MPRLLYQFQRASEFRNRSKWINTNRYAEWRMMLNHGHCRYHDLIDNRDNAVIRNPRMKPLLSRGGGWKVFETRG